MLSPCWIFLGKLIVEIECWVWCFEDLIENSQIEVIQWKVYCKQNSDVLVHSTFQNALWVVIFAQSDALNLMFGKRLSGETLPNSTPDQDP